MRLKAFCCLVLSFTSVGGFLNTVLPSQRLLGSFLRDKENGEDISVMEAFERTAAHLEKLKRKQRLLEQAARSSVRSEDSQRRSEREALVRQYLERSANSLKQDLKDRDLAVNGRKPDLANRLADYEVGIIHDDFEEEEDEIMEETEAPWTDTEDAPPVSNFAGLRLSSVAGDALGKASFRTPSPIQRASIPLLWRGESGILHAETGSGKTLAYLLPIAERLWQEYRHNDYEGNGFAVILTPTRELAAQVAGIAQVLAPPASVRLVSMPTNLMKKKPIEKGELKGGGIAASNNREITRIYVGSAKAIMTSLFGDGRMPAPPTSKPEGKFFLRNVRWLVLDEVDRILHVKKKRKESRYKQHERPAAVVASAVARLTIGRAQVIAASATVGRPLRRELSRVLGLPPEDCPQVIRGTQISLDDRDAEAIATEEQPRRPQMLRAVTIPSTVEHYVTPVNGTSAGVLLTSAYQVIKGLSSKPRKILMVLSRAHNMSTQNVIGALRFFKCKPEPKSLLDVLEAQGTADIIEKHREVSGAIGVGEKGYFSGSQESAKTEYLLVTGEDTVRGLHLEGLDVVVIVGRPYGPDEYTHIAGRTGRAGRPGKVVTVVSDENAACLKSWQRILDVDFNTLEIGDAKNLPA